MLVWSDPIIAIFKRVVGFNDPDRSGDIILLMKDATEDNNTHNRYSSGVACKSWHGSLNPSDSFVPFIVSYPGGNRDVVDNIIKDTNVCANNENYIYNNCEGNWKLPDVVKTITTKQYQ